MSQPSHTYYKTNTMNMCCQSFNSNNFPPNKLHAFHVKSPKTQNSYSILYPNLAAKEPMKLETAAQLVLEYIQLPDDQYRLGKTKVLPFYCKDKSFQVILYIRSFFLNISNKTVI